MQKPGDASVHTHYSKQATEKDEEFNHLEHFDFRFCIISMHIISLQTGCKRWDKEAPPCLKRASEKATHAKHLPL